MKKVGRAYKFGDNISTDLIISGRYKFSIREMKELAKHVMEDVDAKFYQKIKRENQYYRLFLGKGLPPCFCFFCNSSKRLANPDFFLGLLFLELIFFRIFSSSTYCLKIRF